LVAAALISLVIVADASAQSISISPVEGSFGDTVLPAGRTHRIILYYDLTNLPPTGITGVWTLNAWILHSPDGADWGYFKSERLPFFQRKEIEDGIYMDIGAGIFNRLWHKTGNTGDLNFGLPGTGMDEQGVVAGPIAGNVSGTDTVGVLISVGGTGMPSGIAGDALAFEFTTRVEDIGRHICLDSITQPLSGWEWVYGLSGVQPEWTGRCFEIVDCCVGTVGDVNGDGQVSVSDIGGQVDFLFLTGRLPLCLTEADANQSGGVNPTNADITVADIGILVDHLFITGAPLPACP